MRLVMYSLMSSRISVFYYYYYYYYLIELQMVLPGDSSTIIRHSRQNNTTRSNTTQHNTQSYANNKGHVVLPSNCQKHGDCGRCSGCFEALELWKSQHVLSMTIRKLLSTVLMIIIRFCIVNQIYQTLWYTTRECTSRHRHKHTHTLVYISSLHCCLLR
jgi:hypothetical protein